MDIYTRAAELLNCFGVSEINTGLLEQAAELVTSKILNICQTKHIPDETESVVVNIICGEYLKTAKMLNLLGDDFNFNTAVKSINVGDTSVTFALNEGSTPEQKFDETVNQMCKIDKGYFRKYRCLVW